MKPTNHIRWIERETDSGIRGFGYSDKNPLTFPLKTLQQFWEYCDYSAYERKDTDSLGCVDGHYGIWRDIEIVKEEK